MGGFGIRGKRFGLRAQGFGCWVVFRVLDFEVCSGFGISGCVQGFGFWVVFRVLDFGAHLGGMQLVHKLLGLSLQGLGL